MKTRIKQSLALFAAVAALSFTTPHVALAVDELELSYLSATATMDKSGNISQSAAYSLAYETAANPGFTNLLSFAQTGSVIFSAVSLFDAIPTFTNIVTTPSAIYTNDLKNISKGIVLGPYVAKVAKFGTTKEKLTLSAKKLPGASFGILPFGSKRPAYTGPLFPSGKLSGFSSFALGTLVFYKSVLNHDATNVITSIPVVGIGYSQFSTAPNGSSKMTFKGGDFPL